jgi:hypothetical protein
MPAVPGIAGSAANPEFFEPPEAARIALLQTAGIGFLTA